MGLNPNALVELAAAKAFIQPGGMSAADDQRLQEVINRASSLIERWCRRPLAKATYTNLRLRGPCSTDLFLVHTPIAASQPITVTVNAVSLTVWRSESDGDPVNFAVVLMSSCEDPVLTPDVLYRACGWSPSSVYAPANVLVTYSGGWALGTAAGYPSIPPDLEEAALEVVKKIWVDESKGIQDVTTVNLPSGGMTLFDAALPRRAMMLLEPYRRLVVA